VEGQLSYKAKIIIVQGLDEVIARVGMAQAGVLFFQPPFSLLYYLFVNKLSFPSLIDKKINKFITDNKWNYLYST
jgi:hypothetical protein